MSSSTTTLIIVLSVVFAFILAVFAGMLLCFTWRSRHAHRATISGQQARMGNFSQGVMNDTRTREERWSTRKRAGEATHLENGEMLDTDNAANEWGATVHEDGTRSYLNGWFGLDRPSPNSSTNSNTRGNHQRLEGTQIDDLNDAWETKSVTDGRYDDSDNETLREGEPRQTSEK